MKKITVIAIIIFCLLAVAFLVFMNEIVISIRLNELTTSLSDLDRNERSIDHIGLIATYELHKKMYERKISQENADAFEQMIDSLVLKEKAHPDLQVKYGLLSISALQVMNLNRRILGKKPLKFDGAPDSSLIALDIAYYFERNFLFDRAIELYGKALADRKLSNTLRASILLHQGYCYALSGHGDKAKRNYLLIADRYPQENSAITAAILMRYLEGFRLARERVLGSRADPLSVSQNLVDLLGYSDALKILEDLEAKAGSRDIPKITYYMARCYAGLGNPDKAAEKYVEVITSSPSSQYARYSNRQLFLIGSRSNDANLVKISKQLNDKLGDPVLSQMILDRKDVDTGSSSEFVKINLPGAVIGKIAAFAHETKKSPSTVRVQILTSDGNTFNGIIVGENETDLSLLTSIGRINIKKSKIITRKIME